MEANRCSKFLDKLIKFNEEGHYQGEITIGDEIHGYEPYWIEGLNPRGYALNAARFFIYKGNVFMITDVWYKPVAALDRTLDEGYFTIFLLGNGFILDQTMGVELPERFYEDMVMRLKIGF